MSTVFKVFRNHEFARIPKKAHSSDVGYDIAACVHDIIPSKGWKAVRTGLQFEIPTGWEIQVRPRSGLAVKKGITIMNSPGTIDPAYTGELMVIIHNTGEFPFDIHPGDKIAQIVMCPVFDTSIEEVAEINTETERGSNGFGSTGVSA